MKRAADIIISSIFIIFITFGMCVTLFSQKDYYSFYENRSKATLPVFSATSFFEGRYLAELDEFLADHVAYRNFSLLTKTYSDLYIIKRPVVNDIVITEDLLLPYLDYLNTNDDRIMHQAKVCAQQIYEVQQQVENYGGAYCYVGVPCQYTYFSDQYPWYLENNYSYSSTSLRCFYKEVERLGINFVDMSAVFHDLENPRDMYLSTDNHFSLYGAYITYGVIVDLVRDTYNIHIDYPTKEDIEFHFLVNSFMGSRSRKLMGLGKVEERLLMAEFLEPIPFTRVDNEVVADSSVYELPGSDTDSIMYSLYMGGDIANTILFTDRPQLPTILIYGDSFTNAVECLMYFSCNEMHSIDLRYYDEMPLISYVQIVKPDIVICIRDFEVLIVPFGNNKLFEATD